MNSIILDVVCLGLSLQLAVASIVPAKPDISTAGNETKTRVRPQLHLVPIKVHYDDMQNRHPQPPQTATPSTDDSDVKIVPQDDDSWKNAVIIACTIMASIEILILAFMIANWKKIRWTLRKMNCPCCNSSGNRRQRAQDETGDTEMETITTNPAQSNIVTRDNGDIVEISIVETQRRENTMQNPPGGSDRQNRRSHTRERNERPSTSRDSGNSRRTLRNEAASTSQSADINSEAGPSTSVRAQNSVRLDRNS